MRCRDLCSKQVILRFTQRLLPCITFLSNWEAWGLLFGGREVRAGESLCDVGSLEVKCQQSEVVGAWERPLDNVAFPWPELLGLARVLTSMHQCICPYLVSDGDTGRECPVPNERFF